DHGADLLSAGAALALVLLAAIGWRFLGERRVTARVERAFDPLRAKLPPSAAASLVALVRILAVGLVPLSLWGLYALAAELTGADDPYFLLAGILVVAWARLVIAAAALRELVLRPLLPVPPEH